MLEVVKNEYETMLERKLPMKITKPNYMIQNTHTYFT